MTNTALATPPVHDMRALVQDHQPLVRRVALGVLRRLPAHQTSVELDDLINIGMMGLLHAREKYQPVNGQTFEVFAEYRVRGAMLDELRRQDFIPRRLRVQINALRRVEAKLSEALDRAPTDEELAEAMDMSLPALRALRVDAVPYTFVDKDDPYITLTDASPRPDVRVEAMQRRERLLELLKTLPERDQLVLELYFTKEMTQRQIAGVLDLTEGRISQIKSAALRALRERLRGEVL